MTIQHKRKNRQSGSQIAASKSPMSWVLHYSINLVHFRIDLAAENISQVASSSPFYRDNIIPNPMCKTIIVSWIFLMWGKRQTIPIWHIKVGATVLALLSNQILRCSEWIYIVTWMQKPFPWQAKKRCGGSLSDAIVNTKDKFTKKIVGTTRTYLGCLYNLGQVPEMIYC